MLDEENEDNYIEFEVDDNGIEGERLSIGKEQDRITRKRDDKKEGNTVRVQLRRHFLEVLLHLADFVQNIVRYVRDSQRLLCSIVQLEIDGIQLFLHLPEFTGQLL